MTRYAGVVGIRENSVETAPGVFEEVITPYPISGRIDRQGSRWSVGENAQGTVRANHIVSVIAPEALLEQFSNAAYVSWQSVKWTVTKIEYQDKRIKLTLGGTFHE